MKQTRRTFLTTAAASTLAAGAARSEAFPPPAEREWRCYGGDPGARRYSALKQINRENVPDLKVAWTHHTGDTRERPSTTIECTPLVVDGVMYITTALVQVRALDAATGKQLWNFDPFAGERVPGSRGVSRGVGYWFDGPEPPSSKNRRIFATARDKLYCLNADNGKLVESFANGGVLALREGLDRDIGDLTFMHTSPPVVFEDLLIVGGGGGEGPRPAAPGPIRAYDVQSGKRRWIFHTLPRPGEFGYDTWPEDAWTRVGGVNNWAGMSVDEQRGLLFVSTGSAAFDFYGGDRKGANLFANCVLALNARNGKRVWHYQIVHHDLWDYDLPAQPILATIRQGGRERDLVAQLTKTGHCFVFDRETGKPVFEIKEHETPPSDVPGEQAWPTQPLPTKPPPFSPQGFSIDSVTNISPEATAYIKSQLKDLRYGELFTPPSKQGTVFCPGTLGGALWGGGSFDPESGRLFVNSNSTTNVYTLLDAEEGSSFRYGHKGYIRFLDKEGYPAVKPPWGMMNAIDLGAGEFSWREVLGEHPELTARGVPKTGAYNFGGSIVTAGGLVFIGATHDETFRAFDSATGKTLWETKLNAAGAATPCTYQVNGRQYVAIAAGGGGKLGTKSGDEFVAFALGQQAP